MDGDRLLGGTMIKFINNLLPKRIQDNRGIFGLISAGLGLASSLGAFGDDDSNLEGFELPEFFEDPLFGEQQDFLSGLGKDLLGGEFGAFKSLAETGSPELEAVIANLNRDVTTQATEAAARSGRARGGQLPSTVSRNIADATAGLRFQDFLRAQEGKGFLFQQGRGITEGVRGAALDNQAQRNTFNLNTSRLDFNRRAGLDELDLKVGGLQGEGIAGAVDLIGTAVDEIFTKDPDKERTEKTKEIVQSQKGVLGTDDIELGRIFDRIRPRR